MTSILTLRANCDNKLSATLNGSASVSIELWDEVEVDEDDEDDEDDDALEDSPWFLASSDASKLDCMSTVFPHTMTRQMLEAASFCSLGEPT